jgi:3-oxoadipate enol-lactonase
VHVSYTVEGRMDADAPVVVFAHSIGTTRDLWLPQLPAFAKHFKVVRYDARGHGISAIYSGEYTLDMLGHDALDLLDALDVDRVHFVGLSLGGLTAMWLAIHAPERLHRIVLANTAARIGVPNTWTERIAQVQAEGLTYIAVQAMPRWFSESFRMRDPRTVHRFRDMLASCSPYGYMGCCAVLRDTDLRASLKHITTPTLIIAGQQDPATTLEDADVLKAEINGARIVELPTAHLSNVEQPAEFTAAVLDFLNSREQQ